MEGMKVMWGEISGGEADKRIKLFKGRQEGKQEGR